MKNNIYKLLLLLNDMYYYNEMRKNIRLEIKIIIGIFNNEEKPTTNEHSHEFIRIYTYVYVYRYIFYMMEFRNLR